MASVRKRKWVHNGREAEAWIVTYTDQSGQRRQKTFDKKKDADRYRTVVETEIVEGTHVSDSQTITFEQAGELWIAECEKKHKAMGAPTRSTLIGYEQFLKKPLVPRFGKLRMTELTGQMVHEWFLDVAPDYAYDSMRQLRLIISQIIKYCIRTKRLKRNVLTDENVRIPGERKRITVPSQEQLARLLQAMENRAHGEHILPFLQRRAFVGLALAAGLRAGEICGLTWDHVDLENGVIRVRHSFSHINGMKGPKTQAGIRDVPIAPFLARSLEEMRDYCGRPDGGFLFMTKNGENMRKSYQHTLWVPLCDKAGLTKPRKEGQRYGRPLFHFHALRHASVSLLIDRGVNSLHVARFVGHKNVTTTLGIYGHLFPEDDSVSRAVVGIAENLKIDWQAHRPAQR